MHQINIGANNNELDRFPFPLSGDAIEMQSGKPLDKLHLVSYDRGGYICSRGLKKKMVEPAPENVRQVCKERVFL